MKASPRELRARLRRWAGRLFLAVLAPVLFLAAAEGFLRAADIGVDTSFFVKRTDDTGARILTDNPWFGLRFFPARQVRLPAPIRIEVGGEARPYRVLVVGGSAAMGEPVPAQGMPRLLEAVLEDRVDRPVEVINAAMTAVNSHVVAEVVRDGIRRADPDALVIWMGNNEVIGPYGPGWGGRRAPEPPARSRMRVVLSRLRLAHLLRAPGAGDREAGLGAGWRGMEALGQTRIERGAPGLDTVYTALRQNLDRILAMAREREVQVALCTVPVNLVDCAPFASADPPDRVREAWRTAYRAGVRMQESGNAPEAERHFWRAAQLFDDHAELSWRKGRVLEALGHRAEALAAFWRARDLDLLRFRADSEINEVIRRAAELSEGVELVDLAASLPVQSGGAPGREWFVDHVHGTFALNRWAARRVADALFSAADGGGAGDLRGRLGLDAWTRLDLAEALLARRERPPFTRQTGNLAAWRDARAMRAAAQADVRERPAADWIADWQAAIRRRPEDPRLREALARGLSVFKRREASQAAWDALLARYPHRLDWRADRLAVTGGGERALRPFRSVPRRARPAAATLLVHAAQRTPAQGDAQRAGDLFRAAVELDAQHLEARLGAAGATARQDRIPAADALYRQVLEDFPEAVQARTEYALFLALQGHWRQCRALFEEAMQMDEGPGARIQAAGALLWAGRREEARARLEALAEAYPEDPRAWTWLRRARAPGAGS